MKLKSPQILLRTQNPCYSFFSASIGNLMELFWNTCLQSATRFCSRNLYNHAIAQTVSQFTICFNISNVFKHSLLFPPFLVYISQLCPSSYPAIFILLSDSLVILLEPSSVELVLYWFFFWTLFCTIKQCSSLTLELLIAGLSSALYSQHMFSGH